MPNIPSVDELFNEFVQDATGIVNGDLTVVQGFSKNQLQKISEQGVWLMEAEAMGLFNDNAPLRDHFTKGIEELMRNFLATLKGLAIITLEKLWNAMVKIVWSALDTLAGFALPRPIFA